MRDEEVTGPGDNEMQTQARTIVVGRDGVPRCFWAYTSELEVIDHDEVWGMPCHDSDELFARLCLEAMQAGLSWSTILKKQARMREVFHNFIPEEVARMDGEVPSLLDDAGIIRHRGKIEAVIANAKIVVSMKRDGVSLADYLWNLVGGKTFVRRPTAVEQVPAITPEAQSMSKALKKLGFKFVGPTTMYAFMQSAGMVDDHLDGCFRAG